MVELPMCFRQCDVSYHKHNDVEGGFIQIGELTYVKDVDEKIVREVESTQSKNVGRI